MSNAARKLDMPADPVFALIGKARTLHAEHCEAIQIESDYESAWFARRDSVKPPVHRGIPIKSHDDLEYAFLGLKGMIRQRLVEKAKTLSGNASASLDELIEKFPAPDYLTEDHERITAELDTFLQERAAIENDPTMAALRSRSAKTDKVSLRAERKALATVPTTKAGALALIEFHDSICPDGDGTGLLLASIKTYLATGE